VGGFQGLFTVCFLVGPFGRPVTQGAVEPAEGRQKTGAVAVVQVPVQVAQGYGETPGSLGPVAAGDADDGAALGLAGAREPNVAVEGAAGALQSAAGGGEQPGPSLASQLVIGRRLILSGQLQPPRS
jgi:hypothetical protein